MGIKKYIKSKHENMFSRILREAGLDPAKYVMDDVLKAKLIVQDLVSKGADVVNILATSASGAASVLLLEALAKHYGLGKKMTRLMMLGGVLNASAVGALISHGIDVLKDFVMESTVCANEEKHITCIEADEEETEESAEEVVAVEEPEVETEVTLLSFKKAGEEVLGENALTGLKAAENASKKLADKVCRDKEEQSDG